MDLDRNLLEKDIKHYLKSYAHAYAKTASVEITKMAESAIRTFYDQYSPKYYDRTFDLRDKSYSPYFHDNGQVMYGGVRINSDEMMDYRSREKSYVAEYTWRHGSHGFTEHNPENMIYTYPPLDMLLMAVGDTAFLSKLNKTAAAAAKNQKYSMLKFK